MFQSLEALGVEAVGSDHGGGPEPQAPVAEGPPGVALGPVAPGGTAGGGVGATHQGPASPELPRGQGSPSRAGGGGEVLCVSLGGPFRATADTLSLLSSSSGDAWLCGRSKGDPMSALRPDPLVTALPWEEWQWWTLPRGAGWLEPPGWSVWPGQLAPPPLPPALLSRSSSPTRAGRKEQMWTEVCAQGHLGRAVLGAVSRGQVTPVCCSRGL